MRYKNELLNELHDFFSLKITLERVTETTVRDKNTYINVYVVLRTNIIRVCHIDHGMVIQSCVINCNKIM